MKFSLIIIVVLVLVLTVTGLLGYARAYSISEPQSSGITNGVNGIVNGVLQGFAPGGSKDIINNAKGLTAPNVPSLNLPVTSSSSFSAGDLITPIKAVLTLMINLFFVVIQVVVDILKVLLGTISNYKPS